MGIRSFALKVRYYSLAHDPDAMAAEARALAPVLFHIADSLNLKAILLQPTRPLFTRSFPI